MAAEYLIRLDDACPTMDSGRWTTTEKLLDRYVVKPIVAVVPANGDPELRRSPVDPGFWEKARGWSAKGWTIGLHGYSHNLRKSSGGLVPINGISEFTGLAESEQRRLIREGLAILKEHGLVPEVWVAPAHGFDRMTLRALELESDIRTVSDGLSRRAFRRWGFTWLPQQLWRPREISNGLWTICLHPNEMNESDLSRLEPFLKEHRNAFPDFRTVRESAVNFGFADLAFGSVFIGALRAKRSIGGIRRTIAEKTTR